MDFDPFKNLVVNLKATGPAAILVAWIISIVLLALLASLRVTMKTPIALKLVVV